ncbi:hypothetical protein ES705_04447 [subsurface metagenome]|nr:hypothetical protein [Methanosarcinales archaeon]
MERVAIKEKDKRIRATRECLGPLLLDYSGLDKLAQQSTQISKFETKINSLQDLSPQYLLVDRCTKYGFAPITAFAFVSGLVFYLSANIGMAIGLVGIGITSLLLTIVFSVTKSALKE